MSVFMKKFMVLTVSLIIGTSCFAMDGHEPEKLGVAKATVREIARERERERERERKTSPATNVTTLLAPAPHSISPLLSLPSELVHYTLLEAAEANLENFRNMILVSKDFYYSLTGTGEESSRRTEYVKKYVYFLDVEKGAGAYNKSVPLLYNRPQIKVSRFEGARIRGMIKQGKLSVPSPLICDFLNPNALTCLCLSDQFAGNDSMQSIAAFTNLEELDLLGCALEGSDCLNSLSPLTKLKTLYLGYNKNLILDNIASQLPLCLTNLDLSTNSIPDVSQLTFFTNLDVLHLNDCNLPSNTLATLTTLSKLKSLQLTGSTNLTDLYHLSQFTNLTDLAAFDIPVGVLPEGLQRLQGAVSNLHGHIAQIPRGVTVLSISDPDLDDADMQALGRYTHLKFIFICQRPVGNTWLHLSALTNLGGLSIPAQTNEDISSFKALLPLTTIYMH